jgi:hypothetical protein
MSATTLTQTVELNGRRFPRYLTSPSARGWRIADMAATEDDRYLPDLYPNKRMALAAAKKLNRS